MLKFKALILLSLSALLMGSQSIAGETGGGGDNLLPEHGSAWFLGKNKKISYCVKVSPHFGLSDAGAARILEEVFGQWKNYIYSKRWFSDPRNVNFNLTLDVFRSSCDNADLTLYLGTTTNSIEKIKRSYNNPTSIARREKYDVKSGWGKGFVWVAGPASVFPQKQFPDWTKKDALYSVLLHETGHILGLPHIPGTIMTEEISQVLQSEDFNTSHGQPAPLRQIDWGREVTWCLQCTEKYEGLSIFPNDSDFKKITGRLPSGKIKTSVTIKIDHGVKGLALILKDDATEWNLDFHFTNTSCSLNHSSDDTVACDADNGFDLSSEKIFYQYKVGQFPGYGWHGGGVYYGYFKTVDGKKLSANFNYQMEMGPVKIDVLDAGENSTLFANYKYRNWSR